MLNADERFDRYRALYAGGADARLLGTAFRAQVRAWRLDRVLLFDRRINDLGHERGVARVLKDGFDHFTLTIVRDGVYEVDSGHGYKRIGIGEAVLVDMRHPMANRMRDAHVVTMSLARERIMGIAGMTDGLHGRVLPADRTALLLDFIQSLAARIALLGTAAIEAATEALCSLVRIAIGERSEGGIGADNIRRDAARIARVREIIDEQLADPAFVPATVIALSGVSRSTLYRVFQEHGGIAGYIQERRLERVRQALIDGTERRTFAEIAYASGFTSESHCSRLFRERHALRPGEYRTAHALPADPADPVRLMTVWQDEIRS